MSFNDRPIDPTTSSTTDTDLADGQFFEVSSRFFSVREDATAMAGTLDSPVPRNAYACVAPGMAVQATFTLHAVEYATDPREGADTPDMLMELEFTQVWSATAGRFITQDLHVASTPSGREIQTRDLGRLPIEGLAKSLSPALWAYAIDGANGIVLTGMLSPSWDDILSLVDFDVLRQDGPTKRTLTWVARIHAVATLRRQPAAQAVSDAFAMPLSTANTWIRLARKRIDMRPAAGTTFTPTPRLPGRRSQALMGFLADSPLLCDPLDLFSPEDDAMDDRIMSLAAKLMRKRQPTKPSER